MHCWLEETMYSVYKLKKKLNKYSATKRMTSLENPCKWSKVEGLFSHLKSKITPSFQRLAFSTWKEILLLRNWSGNASPSSGEHRWGGGGWPRSTAGWRHLGDIQPRDGQRWSTGQDPTPAALLCLQLHRLFQGSTLESYSTSALTQ